MILDLRQVILFSFTFLSVNWYTGIVFLLIYFIAFRVFFWINFTVLLWISPIVEGKGEFVFVFLCFFPSSLHALLMWVCACWVAIWAKGKITSVQRILFMSSLPSSFSKMFPLFQTSLHLFLIPLTGLKHQCAYWFYVHDVYGIRSSALQIHSGVNYVK